MAKKYRTLGYYQARVRDILYKYPDKDYSLAAFKIYSLLDLIPKDELIRGEWEVKSLTDGIEVTYDLPDLAASSYLWVYLEDKTKAYYVFNTNIGRTETVMSAKEAFIEMRK